MNESVEEKKNKLNYDLRYIMEIVKLVDGIEDNPDDYIAGTLNDADYLDQQIRIAEKIKNRMVAVFKD